MAIEEGKESDGVDSGTVGGTAWFFEKNEVLFL